MLSGLVYTDVKHIWPRHQAGNIELSSATSAIGTCDTSLPSKKSELGSVI